MTTEDTQNQRIRPGSVVLRPYYVWFGVGIAAAVLVPLLASLAGVLSAWWATLFALVWSAVAVAHGWYVRRTLLEPMQLLRKWASQMCGGDLSARISPPREDAFSRLAFHINRLSEALDRLANDMDTVVSGQTEQLLHRNQSLTTLYRVTAALSHPTGADRDANDALIVHAAEPLLDMVGASAAILVIGYPEEPRLVDVRGMEAAVAAFGAGACPPPAREYQESVTIDRAPALSANGWPLPAELQDATLISVPLGFDGRLLGSLEVLVASSMPAPEREMQQLLMSVGTHLGMAIDKHNAEVRSHNLRIMQERNALSHELHDSLAQTIASLGLQAKMLQESLQAGQTDNAARECARIRDAVDDVNVELRELLANFRAPVDRRGLLDALRDMTERLHGEGPCAVYLQHEGSTPELSPAVQMQIMRIVSEALTNARRHSQAQMLRVLVRNRRGLLQVLVEDDGIGMSEAGTPVRPGDHPGDHLGLAIMRERAQRAGGSLTIESEPEEGTRIEFRLDLAALDSQTSEAA
ncbi:MAG: ATP-binding protein [Pseudomonadota bacterium]